MSRLGIITGGDVPLNVRDHSYLIGETAMTVWFTKYGVPMDRLEEGMTLVRELTAEYIEQFPCRELAPSLVHPIVTGLRYAEKDARGDLVFDEGRIRDFDAIVEATVKMVKGVAYASHNTAPIEEALKQITNHVGTDEGPQRE